MRVLLDVDGVVCDFIGGLCAAVPGLREDHFPTWDIARSTGPATAAQLEHIMAGIGFCRSLHWYQGAKEAVVRLNEAHDVAFVTAPFKRSERWMWERWNWLYDEFPSIPIIFTAYKSWVAGDYFADDKVANIEDWEDHHPNGVAFLIDRPWTRGRGRATVTLADVVTSLCGGAT